MTSGLLLGESFADLFRAARTARRLENRPAYGDPAPASAEQMSRFLADDRRPTDEYVRWWEPWSDQVRWAVATGGGYERVRVVDDPPTPYQRYCLWSSAFNAEAGEVVRYLGRPDAADAALPDHDYWVLDHSRVVLMHHTSDHRFLGGHLVTDPDVVAQHEKWMDTAMAAGALPERFADDRNLERPYSL